MKSKVIQRGLAISVFCMAQILVYAKGGAAGSGGSLPLSDIMLYVFIISLSLLVIATVLVLLRFMDNMVEQQQIEALKAEGLYVEKPADSGPSLFKRLYDKAWALVPIDREEDIDLGHDYDGIRELDNRLPPWWLYMFYFTIIWGAGYLYVNQFSDYKMSQTETYEATMKKADKQRRLYLAKMANAVNESNVTRLVDQADLEAGKKLFDGTCSTCHGFFGEGGVGPNFTDDYWLHGGSINDIFKTIKYGVPDKGMISWQSQIQPLAMQQVASYIMTLHGTNPPNPKAPQGDLYVPPKEEAAAE